jgi:hypothetical protein
MKNLAKRALEMIMCNRISWQAANTCADVVEISIRNRDASAAAEGQDSRQSYCLHP